MLAEEDDVGKVAVDAGREESGKAGKRNMLLTNWDINCHALGLPSAAVTTSQICLIGTIY